MTEEDSENAISPNEESNEVSATITPILEPHQFAPKPLTSASNPAITTSISEIVSKVPKLTPEVQVELEKN